MRMKRDLPAMPSTYAASDPTRVLTISEQLADPVGVFRGAPDIGYDTQHRGLGPDEGAIREIPPGGAR